MKKRSHFPHMSCFVMLGCLGAWAPVNAGVGSAQKSEPRTVTVFGEAEIKVVPNQIVISLGVESRDKSLDTAKKDNDGRVKRLLAVARALGLNDKKIATDQISIEPRYTSNHNQTELEAYVVTKSLMFTLDDLTKFEKLLSESLAAGANYVHNVQFRSTELRKHRDAARTLAIKAAKEKAILLAKELNQTIGAPRTITEGQGGWWSYYGNSWGSRYSPMSQNVSVNAGQQASTGDAVNAPGTISVTATVTVTFDLDEK